jgi:hypothetical protein
VDVAVKQPRTFIGGPLLDVPVVIVAVASIREVAREDLMGDRDLALMNLGEAGGEVPLGPAFRSSPVARPAPVVVAGEQQLAPVQLSDECEGLVDASERDITQHPGGVVGVDVGVPSLDQSALFIAVASANGRPE